MDGSGRRNVALLTAEDMANWRATLEEPVSYDYGRYRVHKTGPWGQGPVLLQQLALLKGFDLDTLAYDGADFVHVVTECSKLAFADREAFYGDPAYSEAPVTTLLGDAYNNERRRLISKQASMELRPGLPSISAPRLETMLALARACPTPVGPGGGEPTFAELPDHRGDTVHLDVIDRWGNMIAATPSGGWLQSSPLIPELGFPLGTRAQMFWLAEGLPSSLIPGARPRTTLSPTLIERDGEPYLVCGSPGDQQDQWTLLLLLRHFHHRLNLQESIDSPMFNSVHFPASFTPRAARPGVLSIENRFEPETLNELARRGHLLNMADGWSLGRLCAASSDGGVIKAAATPRHMEAYAICR